MSRVYRVAGINSISYFNLKSVAIHHRPSGDLPEAFDCLNAAEECNRLQKELESAEHTVNSLQAILKDLYDVCPVDVRNTTAARRAANTIRICDPEAAHYMGIH